jgi:hypothetical protein
MQQRTQKTAILVPAVDNPLFGVLTSNHHAGGRKRDSILAMIFVLLRSKVPKTCSSN